MAGVSGTLISYGQNREDVVLWRALRAVRHGRYVEVGANHPVDDSMTKVFHDHGWRGLLVEPVAEYAALLREHRPHDTVVEAAVTAEDGPVTLHLLPGTGLSTVVGGVRDEHEAAGRQVQDVEVAGRRLDSLLAEHGWSDTEVHLLVVDVEGAEGMVLGSVDLRVWRPWVLVIESTFPNSDEPTHTQWEQGLLDAGYRLCLFDGISRFYVAAEHADSLGGALSYPACVLDDYRTAQSDRLLGERARLRDELLLWRRMALHAWSEYAGGSGGGAELGRVRDELASRTAELHASRDEVRRIFETTSWRVTAPLRAVRRLGRRR